MVATPSPDLSRRLRQLHGHLEDTGKLRLAATGKLTEKQSKIPGAKLLLESTTRIVIKSKSDLIKTKIIAQSNFKVALSMALLKLLRGQMVRPQQNVRWIKTRLMV